MKFLVKIGIVIKIQDEFIKNLKFYRKERDASQEKLAEARNCATGTIGCIECGKAFPSFEMIINIAAALKTHPADLFLRNASITVKNAKKILLSELIPQIGEFVEKKL